MITSIIIDIFRSFARASRAASYANKGDYKKAQEIMEQEYEVHP